MRRILLAVALAVTASACTSVKLVQRDGCWIKQTEKRPFKRVREEIGPCTRPQPAWVPDQLTRLVQECVAQADYRWQVRAIEAWAKGNPYPAQPPQEEILRTCMAEARVGLVAENDELKRRLVDLASERNALRTETAEDRDELRRSHDKIAEWLGQAAQKPAGTATATANATSDGTATNENGATLASGSNSGAGAGGSHPLLPVHSAAATPRPIDPPRTGPPPGERPKPASGSGAKATVIAPAPRPAKPPVPEPAPTCSACDAPGAAGATGAAGSPPEGGGTASAAPR
jgi:hypothetical protein